MAGKLPEIELEVSCGGTFRIATEEMACRITVLEPGTRMPVAPAAPAPEPAAAPEAPPPDPFYRLAVQDFSGAVDQAAGRFAVDMGQEAGGATSDKILACRRLLDESPDQETGGGASLAGEVGQLQAKLVNMRFALTFLKNHALLGREAAADGDDEVTVGRADLRKLAAKVKEAVALAQEIHALAGEIKEQLAASDPQTTATPAADSPLVGLAHALLDNAFLLVDKAERKEADDSLDVDTAGKEAAARLTDALAGPADTAGDDGPEAAADDSEMSDEEALKKLAEFGLT